MDRTDHPILPAPRPAADDMAPTGPVTYFYVMTMQSPPRQGGAFAISTYSGLVAVEPGTTRHQLYTGIRDGVHAQAGFTDGVVLYYSAEPNALGGAA
ncbi:hypothetical protein [Streptomyces sp. NPDC056132]|uniref:hypothetical protein n=1 Tax=Streptomyces sp. NPDC056132 TaxID=3345722 RepID=UPI0035DF3C4E